MTIDVAPVTGAGLAAVIPALARLRIAVFRDFPYLYDGDAAYEADYLANFARADGAVIVVARDGDEIVGAATAAPLAAQDAAWQAPLAAAGFDIDRIFYFGESVLLASHRGQGIGHTFFDHREAQARAIVGGFGDPCFKLGGVARPVGMAVDRPRGACDTDHSDRAQYCSAWLRSSVSPTHFQSKEAVTPGSGA